MRSLVKTPIALGTSLSGVRVRVPLSVLCAA